MQFIIEPEVIFLAGTKVESETSEQLLHHIGAPQWRTDATDHAGLITELLGRLCYKAFGTELNANLTKVREGNLDYVNNILKQKHGAVVEHGSATYAIIGCSRVVTHELVRHRIASYSQESLRFVRLTDLKAWFPTAFNDHPKKEQLISLFIEVFSYLEKVQQDMADILELDNPEMKFETKKKLTSAMRRLAPIGLATNIAVTANHRSWRNIILQRTSRHAEEEIRLVVYKIAKDLVNRYPSVYQDYEETPIEGSLVPEVTFEHGEI